MTPRLRNRGKVLERDHHGRKKRQRIDPRLVSPCVCTPVLSRSDLILSLKPRTGSEVVDP
jgi:hypothetical protein